MVLKKVISGGQTGVDQAALEAARLVGLETGGWLPKGCRTLEGLRPDLLVKFGMREHQQTSYSLRTEKNVSEADATLRLARTFESAGEKATWKYIRLWNKPSLSLWIQSLPKPEKVADWIVRGKFEVLNVAGNSEKTAPGIYQEALEYLVQVFKLVV